MLIIPYKGEKPIDKIFVILIGFSIVPKRIERVYVKEEVR
jgi:hypothetical protein